MQLASENQDRGRGWNCVRTVKCLQGEKFKKSFILTDIEILVHLGLLRDSHAASKPKEFQRKVAMEIVPINAAGCK